MHLTLQGHESDGRKRALICGVSGQDGGYLAAFLLTKGYEVYGTSRDAHINPFTNLRELGIEKQVTCVSVALNDFRSVLQTFMQVEPDEVYNLAGQSSVGLSFEQPVETMESVSLATLNLLEAIRFTNKHAKLYNSGSSECFGDVGNTAADETTPFRPRSPYAVAKSAAHWQVSNYREAYDLFACTGILANHESPMRPERFVTRKIVASACRIAQGSKEKLRMGRLDVVRDWGWAPEYVQAMWLMLQQPTADDYVIATGESHSLEAFVGLAFRLSGLNWRDHVEQTDTLYRPSDIPISRVVPAKAERVLGWRAKFHMREVVQALVEAEFARAGMKRNAVASTE